jgi:hypothetical protein
MDEDLLLTQIANGPDMDLNIGGDLQYADSVVVGPPEPRGSSRERVSGMSPALRTSC